MKMPENIYATAIKKETLFENPSVLPSKNMPMAAK
jgi:hypothetical protein